MFDFAISYICLFVLLLLFFFRDRVSLCSPGCPETHFVDQAVLEILRNPPASASQVLGLKACATMPGLLYNFITDNFLCIPYLFKEMTFSLNF